MINKILRNPWVVGVMVVVALIVMFYQAPPSWFSSSDDEAANAAGAKESGSEEEEPEGEPKIEFSDIVWIQGLSRDPFRPARRLLPVAAIDASKQIELKLSAVWIQDSGRWAILNGRIVAKGDRILDYQVEAIYENRVVVVGPEGRMDVPYGNPRAANRGPVVPEPEQ
ncbi:MAG: hypothetical protein ACI8UO_002113 [Verrucomicrobiales bacterium]